MYTVLPQLCPVFYICMNYTNKYKGTLRNLLNCRLIQSVEFHRSGQANTEVQVRKITCMISII